MKFYWVRVLFTVLLHYPVYMPIRTPMYGLPLNQSDQRIRSLFQSVNNNGIFHLSAKICRICIVSHRSGYITVILQSVWLLCHDNRKIYLYRDRTRQKSGGLF